MIVKPNQSVANLKVKDFGTTYPGEYGPSQSVTNLTNSPATI